MVELLLHYDLNLMCANDIIVMTKVNWYEGLTFLENYDRAWLQHVLNQPNEKGIAPIHYACVAGDLDVLNYLIQFGANINLLTKSEYKHGPLDPVNWNRDDWDAWADFGSASDMERYKQDSGYIHPVVSPLAIVNYFHPAEANLIALFMNAGAKYVCHDSIRGQMLEDYLK